MPELVENSDSLYQKGVDIPTEKAEETWNFILQEGQQTFPNTAFVQDREFQENDIDALKHFYQEAHDYQENEFGKDGAVFNDSLMGHLLLSERLVKEAAPLLHLDVYRPRAVALTHDFGRLFSHRRGRNNAIEEALANKFNFKESFRELLPSDTLWTDVDEESINKRVNGMISEHDGIPGLIELIDVLAKWNNKETGELRKWEDIIPASTGAQKTPDKNTMWPTEFTRQEKITSVDGNQAIIIKYTMLKNWFEEKTGMELNQFMKQVEDSIRRNPIQSQWNTRS